VNLRLGVAPHGGRIVTDTFYDSRGLGREDEPAVLEQRRHRTALLTGVSDNAAAGQDITT